jgi:hypothetical protein
MGMVNRNPVASELQQLTVVGGNAVGWLPHVRSWRVACLLARIKERMPTLEKRVYIRLAAIIALDVQTSQEKLRECERWRCWPLNLQFAIVNLGECPDRTMEKVGCLGYEFAPYAQLATQLLYLTFYEDL